MSSLLPPGKSKSGAVFPLPAGCWVEGNEKKRESPWERLSHVPRAGAVLNTHCCPKMCAGWAASQSLFKSTALSDGAPCPG